MKKKVIRYFLASLGVVGLLLTICTTIIYFRGIPRYSVQPVDFQVEKSVSNIEKGKKIAQMKCYSCHYDRKTGQLTGRFLTDVHPSYGRIYSSNITNHRESGIGDWTDNELAYFLRTGVRPNGTFVPPYMPKLIHISDEDLEALIAFLRSDDTLVKANSKEVKRSKPSLKTKVLANVLPSFKAAAYPSKTIEKPQSTNEIELGKYLTVNYECYTCHSSDFNTNNEIHPEQSVGYLKGGNQLTDKNGNIVLAPNILLQKEGIGEWSENDFVQALKSGLHPQTGKAFKAPMQIYDGLTEKEIKAIYAYIQSVSGLDVEKP